MPHPSHQALPSSWPFQPLPALGKTRLCCSPPQRRLPAFAGWEHAHPSRALGTRTGAPCAAAAVQRHLLGVLETLPCGSCSLGSESRCQAGEGGRRHTRIGHRLPPGCCLHGAESVPMEQHFPWQGDSPAPPTRLCCSGSCSSAVKRFPSTAFPCHGIREQPWEGSSCTDRTPCPTAQHEIILSPQPALGG